MFPQAGGSGVGSVINNVEREIKVQAQVAPEEVTRYRSTPHSTISRMVSNVGPCVQQLMKFNDGQRTGSIKNSLEEFWKPFVKTYFTSDAMIMLDILMNTETKSIKLPVEALPSILKSKYDAGVKDDRLLLEMPYEFALEDGIHVVDCPRTTILTTFPYSKVCTDGHLRVHFSHDKKISCWEFTTKNYEELFNRNIIERGNLPDPVCTPYGIPWSALMLFAIAESINNMKSAIVTRMAHLASGNNNNSTVGAPTSTALSPNVSVENNNSSAAPQSNDVKSNGDPAKDTSNIITQLNETASTLMPDKSNNVPTSYTMNGTATTAGIPAAAAAAAANSANQSSQSGVNQFGIEQTSSNPLEHTSQSSAQLHLAHMQSAQQQHRRAMQSHPALMQATIYQQHAMRNNVRSAPNSSVEMLQMFGAGPAADSANQWQGPTSSIFAAASNAQKVTAPDGLSEFTPSDLVGGASAAGAVSGAGVHARPNSTQQNRSAIGARDPLPDGMSPFPFDNVAGLFSNLGGGDPVASSVNAVTAAGPVKRVMTQNAQGNGPSKANKRRRSGTQSSGVL